MAELQTAPLRKNVTINSSKKIKKSCRKRYEGRESILSNRSFTMRQENLTKRLLTGHLTYMCNPVSCVRHRLIFMVLSEFIHLYISIHSYEFQYWSHNHLFSESTHFAGLIGLLKMIADRARLVNNLTLSVDCRHSDDLKSFHFPTVCKTAIKASQVSSAC